MICFGKDVSDSSLIKKQLSSCWPSQSWFSKKKVSPTSSSAVFLAEVWFLAIGGLPWENLAPLCENLGGAPKVVLPLDEEVMLLSFGNLQYLE